jgi:hypothetical protein
MVLQDWRCAGTIQLGKDCLIVLLREKAARCRASRTMCGRRTDDHYGSVAAPAMHDNVKFRARPSRRGGLAVCGGRYRRLSHCLARRVASITLISSWAAMWSPLVNARQLMDCPCCIKLAREIGGVSGLPHKEKPSEGAYSAGSATCRLASVRCITSARISQPSAALRSLLSWRGVEFGLG